MNYVSIQANMKHRLMNFRHTSQFNSRKIYFRGFLNRTWQALATRRCFSVMGSHINMMHSPLRHQIEPAEKSVESGTFKSALINDNNADNGENAIGNSTAIHAGDPASQPPIKEESPGKDETSSDDFLTTIFENLEPYIDTYEVYKQLVGSGFTPSQADEIINLLIFQLNSKLTKLSTIYSQLYELENERYLFESAQQELHVDITRNREQHINDAINQINAMERDYGIISDELNNHFIQMKNDIQVAINDQKSENTLMSKRIMLRMQETNHKITTELNMAMRSEIESLRWHLSRWGLIAILMSIITASAGFYIFRSRHQKQLSEKNEFVPLVIYEPSEFDEDDYHADLDPNAL